MIQPPLDARGRKDGFNVIYNLNDLGLPFIYSSLFASAKTWKEKPAVVQKAVAALAESVYFVEKNPELAMASVGKTLRLKDPDTLRAAYDAYAKNLINRRMIIPEKLVAELSKTLDRKAQRYGVAKRIFDTFCGDWRRAAFEELGRPVRESEKP